MYRNQTRVEVRSQVESGDCRYDFVLDIDLREKAPLRAATEPRIVDGSGGPTRDIEVPT